MAAPAGPAKLFWMRKLVRWLPAVALLGSVSCAFLLDFDELTSESGDAGSDASSGGAGGSGGSGGSGGGGTGGGSGGVAGTGGGAGDAGDGGPLDDFPKQSAQAVCDKLAQCYGPEAVPLLFGDADCVTYFTSTLLNATFAPAVDSVKAGKIDVDPSQVGKCLSDFAALPCGLVSPDFPEACRQVLKGKASAGSKCSHLLECQPGLYCDLTGGCTATQCAAYGKPTEACSPTQPCGQGLTCLQGKCAPLAKQGEPCEGADKAACEVGLICFGGSQTVPGQCVASKGLFSVNLNEKCSYWLDVFGDAGNIKLCKAGGHCDVFSLVPQPKCLGGVSGGVGVPCSHTIPDQCPKDLFCTQASDGGGSVCAPMPTNGEACAPVTAVKGRCAAYHRCDGTTCVLLRNNGQCCSADLECYSGVCNKGAGACASFACPVN